MLSVVLKMACTRKYIMHMLPRNTRHDYIYASSRSKLQHEIIGTRSLYNKD